MSNAELSVGNRPKSALSALVLAGLVALAGVALFGRYGTVEPCGILRESVRREANREGGFGGFIASVLPDSVMNGIIGERYGALTPTRCLGILLGLESMPESTLKTARPRPPIPALNTVPAPTVAQQRETKLREFANFIDALVQRMDAFDRKTDIALARFSTGTNRDAAITARMSHSVVRERSLSHPDQGLDRGQIVLDLGQDRMDVEQLLSDFRSERAQIQREAPAFRQEVLRERDQCALAQQDRSEPQPIARVKSACAKFGEAFERFEHQYAALTKGLEDTAASYNQEMREQNRLLTRANQLR